MDSEDSDSREEDYGPFPELTERVILWSDVIESGPRRKSLEAAGKVYFYSPIIFAKSYFTGYWSEAVTDKLLTNMRFELVSSDAGTFLTQMDLLERTYMTVCGTLKEYCDDHRKDEVASLMHFANHCEHEESLEQILKEASSAPLFESIRSNLAKTDISKMILLLCLKYYFYILEMVVIKRKDPEKALIDHPKKILKKIEDLKGKGNALFQSNRYRKAIKYYTDAIKLDRYNPVLYCNRAQANLYLDENWEALLDAKRAILLNPTWPKAYYRFSQALFELDFTTRAIKENRLGQKVCRQGDHDIKDLQLQLDRMLAEKERVEFMEKVGSLPPSLDDLDYETDESSSDSEDRVPVKPILDDSFLQVFDGNRRVRIDTPATQMINPKQMKRQQEKERKEREKREKDQEAERAKEKKKEREREIRQKKEEDRKRKLKEEENQRNTLSKKEKRKKLIQDRDFYLSKASTALVEGRARQAYEDYMKAEEVMEESTGKYGSLTEGGRVIFLYAQGMAALETANPQLFPVAMEKFDTILTSHPTIRTALPHYGKAKTLFCMNRFPDALSHIEDACTIADGFATSVETWPGSNKTIKETESPSQMLESLKDLRDQCLHPRPPEAVCRNPECESTSIYFNDIEFVGFVKVHCSDQCKMDYHIECWRKLRSSVKRKTDKDMLDSECFTPDCSGLIHDVSTYGGDALVKSRVTKKEAPHEKVKTVKPVSKQMKKDKKAKRGKLRERNHKEGHAQDDEITHVDENKVDEQHPVEVTRVVPEPVVEPPKAEPQVVPMDDVEPLEELTNFEDDEAETALLHQEPAYIIKKENPDQVEEKKLAPKPVKTKNKKKREVIMLEHRFYDQDNRYLMTAEDAPVAPPDSLCLGYQSGASNQAPGLQKLPPVLLTEEEQSHVLVLQIHFLEILENNGPLKINDPILVEEVKRLPIDSQELINRHGGLASFLCVSEDFAMVENYVCRNCDLTKCRTIVDHQKIEWTSLPKPGAPPSAHRRHRPPWTPNQYGVDQPNGGAYGVDQPNGGAVSQEPEIKMNTLDTFNDYSESEGTDGSSGPDGEVEEEDSSPSGGRESTPPDTPSREDLTSPPWTPNREENGQNTVITSDFDGDLDQLISGEQLTVGDAFSSSSLGDVSSEGKNDGSTIKSFQELGRHVVVSGKSGSTVEQSGEVDTGRAVDDASLEEASKVCDGFEENSPVDTDEELCGYLSQSGYSSQQESASSVDRSDGSGGVGKIMKGDLSAVDHSQNILCEKGDDVSVDKPDVGTTKGSTDNGGVVPPGHSADATGDNNKHMVGGNVAGETPKLSPGRDPLECEEPGMSNVSSNSQGPALGGEGGGALTGAMGDDLVSGVKKIMDAALTNYDHASGRDILAAGPSTLGVTGTLDAQGPTDLDGRRAADLDLAKSRTWNELIDTVMDRQINEALKSQGKTLDTQDVALDAESGGQEEKFIDGGDQWAIVGTGAIESASGADLGAGNSSNVDMRSSLDKLNQDEVVMRCNSGDRVSSTSSGISISPTLSVNATGLQEKVSRWAGFVRAILGLHPDFGGTVPKDEYDDSETLMEFLSDKFYKYVEELKEASVKPETRSVETAAKVSVAVKWTNTDPLCTYEAEFREAERKCENLEAALRDAFSKYKSLENMLAATQNEKFQQNRVIDDLQRNLRITDEKLKKDISTLHGEKSSLLLMVHELEAKSRATQSTLQEYEAAKEIMTQTQTERDDLKKVQTDLEQKVEELRKECQKQEQRANKSEVSIVQIHKEQALKPLSEALKECDFHVRNLNQVLAREPRADLTIILKDWERCLDENKQKLDTTTSQFDGQIKQLQSGIVLTDLPVIPRPEPSRSKSLKNPPGPPWPRFGGPPPSFPPARFQRFNGPPPPFIPPGAMPPRMPPHGMPPHPRQQGMPGQPQGLPQQPPAMPPRSTSPQVQPSTSSPPASTPNSTPPLSASPAPMMPPNAHLPPARGATSTMPAGPGTTMPLAPGPGEAIPSTGGRNLAQNPIGTRNAMAVNGGMVNGGAVGRETDSPVMGEAIPPTAKPSGVPGLSKKTPSAQAPGAHQGQAARASGGSQSGQGAQGQGRSSYQRIMDRLGSKFPSYNKIQLTNFLRIVRVNNGNSLSGLSMDGITQKVEELVAEAQAKIPQKPGQAVVRVAPVAKIPSAPAQNPWSLGVDEPSGAAPPGGWSGEMYNDEEDPCVICHEEMTLKEVLDLECGHRFHADCIQEWLRTKSTCPNCRKFTKLKQDFPPLPLM